MSQTSDADFQHRQRVLTYFLVLFIAIPGGISLLFQIKTAYDDWSAKQLQLPVVRNSEWDGSVRQVERWLEDNLKDPKSFEAIAWGPVKQRPDGIYYTWVKYRARNSFGAMTIEHGLFTLDAAGNIVSHDILPEE